MHGDAAAAGLVYPKSNNLYEVKYFAAEITDGRISNIYQNAFEESKVQNIFLGRRAFGDTI